MGETPRSHIIHSLGSEYCWLVYIHTEWSWWFKQSDWSAISNYDAIFTALGGKYKAEQNRCHELGVLPKFHSKNFLKIQEYQSVDDFEGKKRLHAV